MKSNKKWQHFLLNTSTT